LAGVILKGYIVKDSSGTTQDGGGHLNPAGGVLCATQLWKELNKNFPTSIGKVRTVYDNNAGSVSTKVKSGCYLLNGRKLTSAVFTATTQRRAGRGGAQTLFRSSQGSATHSRYLTMTQ